MIGLITNNKSDIWSNLISGVNLPMIGLITDNKSDIWSNLITGVNLPMIGLITDNKSAYVSSDTLVREILAAYRIF